MIFGKKKTPLDRLDEQELRAIVLRQERTFKAKDRELLRLNQQREQLLEQAKNGTPTERSLLREKYKVNRNEREMIADEYRKGLAMYRITNMVYQAKRSSTRKERAVDVVGELVSKTGLSPDKVHTILRDHGISDQVELEPWQDLAEELDQVGILRSEYANDLSRDDEFDTLVDILAADPNRDTADVVGEMERASEARTGVQGTPEARF